MNYLHESFVNEIIVMVKYTLSNVIPPLARSICISVFPANFTSNLALVSPMSTLGVPDCNTDTS